MVDALVIRVAARFLRQAGPRQDAQKASKPINKPKGISQETVREYARTEDDYNDETVDPKRTDIRPSDVFQPKPRHMNVLDYVNKGWPGTPKNYKDMSHAIKTEIPKDKGHATVNNLSQYLIRTDGGGDTPAAGTNKAK